VVGPALPFRNADSNYTRTYTVKARLHYAILSSRLLRRIRRRRFTFSSVFYQLSTIWTAAYPSEFEDPDGAGPRTWNSLPPLLQKPIWHQNFQPFVFSRLNY